MAVFDLSEKLKDYGIYDIKVQSFADGFEPSDIVEKSYIIGPKIRLDRNKIYIVDAVEAVVAFDLFIDGVIYDTLSYDHSDSWYIDIINYDEALNDGTHALMLQAIGDNICTNRSNKVSYYKGLAPIYGVKWENDLSTTMTRTDDAINLSYAIQSSTGSIVSDFNDVFPWNETEIVDISGGKFLHMPEMFFRISTIDSNITGVAVSRIPTAEGNWYKTDEFYYSIYGGSSPAIPGNKYILQSLPDKSVIINYTKAQARTYAKNLGDGYQILDLYHHTIMIFLWWIEWATKDSQSIFPGMLNTCRTGGTDALETPSAFNPQTGQARYHYIEDFFGNIYQYLDGAFGSNDRHVYVCSDPQYYDDTTTLGHYSLLSYQSQGNGIIKAYGWDENNPFLCYYSLASTQAGGFVCNGVLPTDTTPSPYVGERDHSSASRNNQGLNYIGASQYTVYSASYGARLIYKQPNK